MFWYLILISVASRDVISLSFSLVLGGFHMTQISLIITQVKNKVAYHSINCLKKLTDRRRVINKQRAKVLGMCDIPNSSYSARGITENYSVSYGDAMLEPVSGTSNMAAGNQWKHLEFTLALSKRLLSLSNLKTFA